jgi:DNA uptake protein ComE-like DNA-binding protein
MKKSVATWLYFTRSERQTLLFFCCLCAVVWSINRLWDRIFPPEATDFQTFHQEITAFRVQLKAVNADSTGAVVQSSAAAGKVPVPLFPFDPNTADAATLKRLGLSQRAVKSITGYRAKGGHFKQPEDLKKMYGLSEAEYATIADYAIFPETKQQAAAAPLAYSGGTGGSVTKPVLYKKIDINRDPLEMWEQLPGIGEKRARQILNFREKLGGFLSVEQVGETRGLPDTTFARLRPYLELPAVQVRKININAASEEDLSAHPYCGKNEARLIVQYRTENGPYRSVGDLQRFLSTQWYAKIAAYLDIR